MSLYIPTLEELKAEQDARGWWVCDRFGRIDGPYQSEGEARSTFLFHADAEACLDSERPGFA